VGVEIDRAAWEVPAIFRLIETRGAIGEREMYRVFNMGIGLVVLVAPEEVEQALASVQEAVVIGQTIAWDERGPRVRI
jgi:phosphoribosylformylglycinamidine cyclo-ligase